MRDIILCAFAFGLFLVNVPVGIIPAACSFYYLWTYITLLSRAHDFVLEAERSGELPQMLDDFEAALPALQDNLRMGLTWFFGAGAGAAVRVSEISFLFERTIEQPEERCDVLAVLVQGDKPQLLCRMPKGVFKRANLDLLYYCVSRMNPRAKVPPHKVPHERDTAIAGRFGIGGQVPVAVGTWGECPWDISGAGVLTVWPGRAANCGSSGPWNGYEDLITTVVLKPGVVLPPICCNLLNGCASLKAVNTREWDTSQVTNMSRMFRGCSSLGLLDVAGWNTSRVTTMMSLFEGCASLGGLDPSRWDTSSVRDIAAMFLGCSSLLSLDLSRWDMTHVEDVSYAFSGCAQLSGLDISGWQLPAGAESWGVFDGCPAQVNDLAKS